MCHFTFILGLISWLVLFVILGKKAAPGGDLFDLIALIVAANFGGFLMSLTSLPRLIGMLATGILLQVSIFLQVFILGNCRGKIQKKFKWKCLQYLVSTV